MRIVPYIKPGVDCPASMAGNPEFRTHIIEVTRERLDLRPEDIVEVVFI
jgi:hypothetical protein